MYSTIFTGLFFLSVVFVGYARSVEPLFQKLLFNASHAAQAGTCYYTDYGLKCISDCDAAYAKCQKTNNDTTCEARYQQCLKDGDCNGPDGKVCLEPPKS